MRLKRPYDFTSPEAVELRWYRFYGWLATRLIKLEPRK